VAVSPKKGICLDNPYPYLDNIQTPAVAPPPPRGVVRSYITPSPLLAVGIRSQSLQSRRNDEQTRALHRQPGERQGRSSSTSVNHGWQTLPLGLAGAIPPFATTKTTTPPSSISSPAQPAVCGYSRSIRPQIDPATSPADQALAPDPCQQTAAADDPRAGSSRNRRRDLLRTTQ